jgi:hypothetical protein
MVVIPYRDRVLAVAGPMPGRAAMGRGLRNASTASSSGAMTVMRPGGATAAAIAAMSGERPPSHDGVHAVERERTQLQELAQLVGAGAEVAQRPVLGTAVVVDRTCLK